MGERDTELIRLLIEECERHARALADGSADASSLRRTLHAVKGSAGVAGETALADAFARFERRAQEGSVREEAVRVLRDAIENLRAGRDALPDSWPTPPAGLVAAALPAELAGCYVSEMRERIAGLDAVLADGSEPKVALEQAFRIVHGMKGAASAVRDEPVAWFCHGLEARLGEGLRAPDAGVRSLEDLSAWRSMISQMLDAPGRSLQVLARQPDEAPRDDAVPTAPSSGPSAAAADESWLHVPSAAIDRVLERLRLVGTLSRETTHQADVARTTARSLRSARTRLMEARRLIGPPRPWGVPAAALQRVQEAESQLAHAATSIERLAATSSEHARAVQKGAAVSQIDLESLRRATMAVVFDKVRAAVEASADRRGDQVRVEVRGAATPVERRLADALVDPVLQLARNAVAHGIEPAELRSTMGKPRHGSVVLAAETRGAHLVVSVQDDGAGVDVSALRERALEAGLITPETARDVDDEALVHLVFLPGLTTRRAADLLAGRGVGLDLALHAVRRLGGTIRMHNRPSQGLRAVIEVPLVERGQIRVVWVSTGAHHVALPARQVLRVRPRHEFAAMPRSLASWLDPHIHGADDGLVLDLVSDSAGDESWLSCSVHSVDAIEETSVRPVPPLVATAGPYVGVILGADGTPALLVDALVLAERQRAVSAERT